VRSWWLSSWGGGYLSNHRRVEREINLYIIMTKFIYMPVYVIWSVEKGVRCAEQCLLQCLLHGFF
jgi:hypothetical protein